MGISYDKRRILALIQLLLQENSKFKTLTNLNYGQKFES